jgi:hypothetical protein
MKYLLFVFCSAILASCSVNEEPKQPKWLVGNWIRTNDKPQHITYETWRLDSKNNLIGIGFTLKENDTTFKESISIITKNDSLFFQVAGVNKNPTLFKFSQQTDTSFVCENKSNEFPKKIYYFKSNNNLNAVVSNDDFEIKFFFNRQKD